MRHHSEHRIPAAMRRINEEFGLLVEGMEMREICGWVYARMVPSAARSGVPHRRG